MASRSMSAILWTLVSLNVLSLVAGGLVTWLGYTSPARLKQLGLLPELVILGGFSSLVVACIGLCALNYSSHHALNIYGFSCAIFAIVLVGGIPEAWQRKLNNQARSNLFIDFAYFAFLLVLVVLLVSAFAFAQYLRRREQEEGAADDERLNSDNESPSGNAACTCSNHPAGNNKWALTSFSNDNYSNDRASFSNHQHRGSNNNLVGFGRGFHLSDIRVPMYANANNPYGHKRFSGAACCTNPQLSAPNFAGSERALISGRHELAQALIHKGFYEKTANLSRIKSGGRQLDGADKEATETHLDVSECVDNKQSDGDDEDLVAGANAGDDDDDDVDCKSAASDRRPALDADSASYGTQPRSNHARHHHHHHHRPPLLTRSSLATASIYRDNTACRCGFASANPLLANPSKAVSMLRSSYDSRGSMNNCCQYLRRQITNSPPRTATLPLNLMSTYAIRSKPARIRAKGSSSVMATTVAAAAALLGSVPDTSSLMHPNEAANCDELFSCNDAADYSNLIDVEGFHFNDDNQQLGASGLMDLPDVSSGFHENVCQ